jgi:hypothetical protein
MDEEVLIDEQADKIRKAFDSNRNASKEHYRNGMGDQDLAPFRAAIAGSLAGTVDAIEEELTTLNARKELLEEELYKYKAAADLMLKQMTNEQN